MAIRDWKGTAKMTVQKLGNIIGTTTDTGGTATTGTLMAKVNALIGAFAAGVTAKSVKSVQRGLATIPAKTRTITVAIEAVDMSKAVLHHGGSISVSKVTGTSASGYYDCAMILKDETTIEITKEYYENGHDIYVAWQVEEKY